MEETAKKPGGKREGQKYKSLLVWDILLKKTDENHALQLVDIKRHFPITQMASVTLLSMRKSQSVTSSMAGFAVSARWQRLYRRRM